jgi:anti-anti-sigma factor
MMDFQQFQIVDVDEGNGAAVIEVEVDLDYLVYSGFKEAVNDLIERGIVNLTYDLSNRSYIQSLALGIIMWSYVEVVGRGGKITIHGASERIKEVFTSVQLDTLVTLE